MPDDEAPRREKITAAQLVIAAVALAVLGFFLVFDFGGDDASTAGTAQTSDDDEGAGGGTTDDEQDDTPPSTPSPTGGGDASTAGDETTPPTLPPGMERPGPTAAPEPSTVDRGSPSKIALAALTAAYSMDTTTDESPADALQRAEPWLAEPWDARAFDLEDLEETVEDDWDTWADHDGYASINTIMDVISNDAVTPEQRGDTETTAMRKIAVSFTPLGRDGWNGELMDATWYVHLERESASAGWGIVEMRRPVFDPTAQPLPTSLPTSSPT